MKVRYKYLMDGIYNPVAVHLEEQKKLNEELDYFDYKNSDGYKEADKILAELEAFINEPRCKMNNSKRFKGKIKCNIKIKLKKH